MAASSPQKAFLGGKTLIVIPFENHSSAPGLAWVSEAFPEVLEERLSSPSLYVLSLDDRLRAYDQMGIPAELNPSRATIYRIAEQIGVDYVVLGGYTFDGRTFTATAQLLDMNRQRLSPEVHESGPLVELVDIESLIAWDLVRTLRPDLPMSREEFRRSAQPIRLDALESYVRGILVNSPQEKVQRFQQALRLSPDYSKALWALGKTYYSERQYDQAISTLAKIKRTDPLARQANFLLGLSAYFRGDYARARNAFEFVASELPLTEVYNNLGVLAARQGDPEALGYFEKAVQADPVDPDYRFNLALTDYRAGKLSEAREQIKEAVNLRPSDLEAKSFLDSLSPESPKAQPGTPRVLAHAPLERIKRNYDESSFRLMVLDMETKAEQALAKDPRAHSRFHVKRAQELLGQGFVIEAEREFREAIALDNKNAEAHAGLAETLLSKQDLAGARSEAQLALVAQNSVEPLLVLTQVNLKENKAEAAAETVRRALALDPTNRSALALERATRAKLAEKVQPTPTP